MSKILTDEEAAARIDSRERAMMDARPQEMAGFADMALRAGVETMSSPLPGTGRMGGGYNLRALMERYNQYRNEVEWPLPPEEWVNFQLRQIDAPEIPPKRKFWSRIFGN